MPLKAAKPSVIARFYSYFTLAIFALGGIVCSLKNRLVVFSLYKHESRKNNCSYRQRWQAVYLKGLKQWLNMNVLYVVGFTTK